MYWKREVKNGKRGSGERRRCERSLFHSARLWSRANKLWRWRSSVVGRRRDDCRASRGRAQTLPQRELLLLELERLRRGFGGLRAPANVDTYWTMLREWMASTEMDALRVIEAFMTKSQVQDGVVEVSVTDFERDLEGRGIPTADFDSGAFLEALLGYNLVRRPFKAGLPSNRYMPSALGLVVFRELVRPALRPPE